MESYLKNHAFVRWSIIIVLCFCIGVQLLLIRHQLANKTLIDTKPINESLPTETLVVVPSPTATKGTLSCQVMAAKGVNVRTKPGREFGEIINTLPLNSQFDPLGRHGDPPWLLVLIKNKLGWISSKGVSGENEVECQKALLEFTEIDLTADLLQLIITPSPEATATLTLTPKTTPKRKASFTPSPTNTPTMTATVTVTSTPNALLRQYNGPDIRAPRRTFNISLDGNLSEWEKVSGVNIDYIVDSSKTWQGANDLSGLAFVTWDYQYLYLAVQVTDDKIVQQNSGQNLEFGDGIELYWDSQLEADFDIDEYNDDDSRIVFAPISSQQQYPTFWLHVYSSPHPDNIQIGGAFTETGYNIEARMPWILLGAVPDQNAIFGAAITIIDNDTEGTSRQETQIFTTPNMPNTSPTNLGNFILEP